MVSSTLAVLAYHKIGPPTSAEPPTPYHTPLHVLRGHLETLAKHGWSVVGIDEVLSGLTSPGSLPERAALLTFDDGYRSVLEFACPVLEELGLRAAAFVPTDYIGSSSRFDAENAAPICSLAELRELEAAGISVQSHGASHVKLSTLSPSAVEEEARRSKATLEDALGKPVEAFAYPFGDPGDSTVVAPALARVGYRAAFLYGGTPFRLPVADAYEVPRIPVEPDVDVETELERTIRSDLRRHLELATAARWRSLATGRPDTDSRQALASLLLRHVPRGAGVAWLEPGLRPVLPEHALLPFPSPPPRTWQVFASGSEGSRAAPWIAPRYAYEFRLRQEGEVVAAVTVVAEPPAFDAPFDRRGDPREADGPYVRAVPNPVPLRGAHGSTTVAWSTVDGSPGEVEMTAYPIDEDIPQQDGDAIAALERLRANGADFLLAPDECRWWLDAYPDLNDHLTRRFSLLADEPGVGRLYDLRATPRR